MRLPEISTRPTTLYHYTCDHTLATVGSNGRIYPLQDLMQAEPEETAARLLSSVVWFTSIPDIRTREDAEQIALSDVAATKCERWKVRYRVTPRHTDKLVRWDLERLTWPESVVEALESTFSGAKPETWYLSRKPVPVMLDQLP